MAFSPGFSTTNSIAAALTKIGRTALGRSGSLRQWSGLIANGGIARRAAAALNRPGVRILTPRASGRNGE